LLLTLNPYYQTMNPPDSYTLLGLKITSRPFYHLQFPELVLAYRANYLMYYMNSDWSNWNMFEIRLKQWIAPDVRALVELNGYHLTLETPGSIGWYVYLDNQKVIQMIMNSPYYASLSDEELLNIMRNFHGPPVIREAMLLCVNVDRLAVLENLLWLEHQRPDYLAWLEGLD